jgi:hypothetical protein
MATNPPSDDGHRNGAVRGRSQVLNPNNHWTKRDANTGEFIDQKTDGEPFKGVRKERPADESDEERPPRGGFAASTASQAGRPVTRRTSARRLA